MAFDIFKPRQADLFQIIPYLLHENIALPGIRHDFEKKTPHGIFDYHPGPESIEIISKYARGKRYTPAHPVNPAIEGLFTMGSIGSVAQADDSDIDYWVCIHEERFNRDELALLEKKLRTIEAYAWEEFHLQVTFFTVDLLNLGQSMSVCRKLLNIVRVKMSMMILSCIAQKLLSLRITNLIQ